MRGLLLPHISDFNDRTGGETPPLQTYEYNSTEILFSLPNCVIMEGDEYGQRKEIAKAQIHKIKEL